MAGHQTAQFVPQMGIAECLSQVKLRESMRNGWQQQTSQERLHLQLHSQLSGQTSEKSSESALDFMYIFSEE